MSFKLLNLPRIVVYGRNLSTFFHTFRTFSSKPTPQITATGRLTDEVKEDLALKNHEEQPLKKHADREVHLLGPKDHRAILPGNVGIESLYFKECASHASQISSELNIPEIDPQSCDLLNKDLPSERHSSVVAQYFFAKEMDKVPPCIFLECVAQACPVLVRKDLANLFPNRNLLLEELTVITFSERTDSDMSYWSDEVEEEREKLTEHFVAGAAAVCVTLREAGFWADFIDPSSGLPYKEDFTSATFLETDERYRYFGFTIDDLGCCKVIRHHLWGSHVFVGSLFTNAPADSDEVKGILRKCQSNYEQCIL